MVIKVEQLPMKIKDLRGSQSQADFAARFGVTRALVSLWETGRAIPRPKVLRELQIEKAFVVGDVQ